MDQWDIFHQQMDKNGEFNGDDMLQCCILERIDKFAIKCNIFVRYWYCIVGDMND